MWRGDVKPEETIHIKGFGAGSVGSFYDQEAIAQLQGHRLLVWDGDAFKDHIFTKLVPMFLAPDPNRWAVAFRMKDDMEGFRRSWGKVARQFPGRIAVVPVDVEGWAREAEYMKVRSLPRQAQLFFLLGRMALKTTGSKRVLALGGGGIAAMEAQASEIEGVEWTVCALSRGKQETGPTLMDWALNASNATLLRGKDPDEALCFASSAPS